MWLWVNTHGSFPLGLVAVGSARDRPPPRPPVAGDGGPSPEVGCSRDAARCGEPARATAARVPDRAAPAPGRPVERRRMAGAEVRALRPASLPRRPAARHRRSRAATVMAGGVCRSWSSLRHRCSGRATSSSPASCSCPASLVGSPDIGTVTGEERRPIFRPMAAALAVVGCPGCRWPPAVRSTDLDGYPVAAVTWAEREGLLGPDARLVSQDYVGNYLEARYGTAVKVFIDDRYDMFPETVVNDFLVPQCGARPAGRKCSIATRHQPCSGPSTNLWDSSWPSPAVAGGLRRPDLPHRRAPLTAG